MASKTAEKGQRAYDQETPRWREFFDILAARLADKEVLFIPDIQTVAEQSRLLMPMTASSANTSLQSWRRQSIMLYLGVDVGRERLYHKPMFFDRQHHAEDLRLHEAIARNMSEIPPYSQSFQERVDQLLARMQESHLETKATS